MYVATDHGHGQVCIAATARYVPKAHVRPEALAQEPAATPNSMREAVMRSVYADTLRWRQVETPPVAANHPSRPVHPAMPTHVASELRLSLSEMTSAVASEAIRRYPSKDNHVPDQIIVCGTSLEHDLALSCAGRLHSELGSTGAPFAIGQIQGVSFFLALQVAADMMASDDRMHTTLIVAAERWLPPFSRQTGSLTVLADGAAAILVRREACPGWHVRSLTVGTPSTSVSVPPQDICIDEEVVVEVIEETCAQTGLKPTAFDWIVPPRINTTLACNVSAEARLPVGRMWYPESGDIGYLCAADAPAQLHVLLQTIVPADGQRILLWSAGFQGQAACAVLEYRGS
ncbi:3-oxoacyl-ACP synthase [Paraburkholderia fungorum]|uniref:3-oxoacyl-ACP synthase n=1 Tax=Paraburkholderia fungorum TaxID=134537 RepID=UPI000DB234CC|nr:3-oxoacyl-ACP synthase [Paraburkholderia fungorum]PZR50612.1 MAG: 3-oxoacyl-ACP synthase [Paraburkholderia fungorum]